MRVALSSLASPGGGRVSSGWRGDDNGLLTLKEPIYLTTYLEDMDAASSAAIERSHVNTFLDQKSRVTGRLSARSEARGTAQILHLLVKAEMRAKGTHGHSN